MQTHTPQSSVFVSQQVLEMSIPRHHARVYQTLLAFSGPQQSFECNARTLCEEIAEVTQESYRSMLVSLVWLTSIGLVLVRGADVLSIAESCFVVVGSRNPARPVEISARTARSLGIHGYASPQDVTRAALATRPRSYASA